MARGPRLGLPRVEGAGDRRSLLIAIGLHVGAFILISSAVALPVLQFLNYSAVRARMDEHVTYVTPVPPRTRDSVARPRAGPRPQPAQVSPVAPPAVSPPVVAPPVTPPAVIPTGVAPPRGEATIGDTVDRRTVGRGLLPGLSPGPVDPRLLRPAPVGVPTGPTAPDRGLPTDSITRSWIHTYWDSLARLQANARNPTDWTFDRKGTKYGVDPQFMYFGKFKIPTMLLALLPINMMANPTVAERNRVLESVRYEIQYQAMRAANDKDFNEAVKALRARKEAEHLAAQKKKRDSTVR